MVTAFSTFRNLLKGHRYDKNCKTELKFYIEVLNLVLDTIKNASVKLNVPNNSARRI